MTRLVLLLGIAAVTIACDEGDVPRPPPDEPVVSTLTVIKAGDGTGILRTLPAGAVCDVDCQTTSFDYEDTAEIEVVAEPSRKANFGGLVCTSGDDERRVEEIGGNDDASLSLPTIVDGVGQEWTCSGTFVLVHTLQIVATPGTGSGRVRGALSSVIGADLPKRVDCGSADTCVAAYFDGEEETLTATADVGSVFVGWEFCAGNADTPTIALVMNDDEDCRPVFDLE